MWTLPGRMPRRCGAPKNGIYLDCWIRGGRVVRVKMISNNGIFEIGLLYGLPLFRDIASGDAPVAGAKPLECHEIKDVNRFFF